MVGADRPAEAEDVTAPGALEEEAPTGAVAVSVRVKVVVEVVVVQMVVSGLSVLLSETAVLVKVLVIVVVDKQSSAAEA